MQKVTGRKAYADLEAMQKERWVRHAAALALRKIDPEAARRAGLP